MKSINPANGEIIHEYSNMDNDVVKKIINDAAHNQPAWREQTFRKRSDYLIQIAKILNDKKRSLAKLMALEMGKPLKQGISEIEKCAWVCEYYANKATEFLAPINIQTDASKSYVTYNPLGTVLAIMPWNFPFWQLFRFAAPALMAGNAVLLKHAENVTGCALEIEKIIHEAGIPSELFRTIIIEVEQVQSVIKHHDIHAITLTGSTRAGKAVSSQAGKVLKPTVLELGGSDPYIILKDADIELASEKCVTSRLINSGQSCIAAKRFIVAEEVHDQFLDLFIEKMKMKKVGDPFDERTDIGPMARVDLRDQLHKQVQDSIEKGAKLQLGGDLPVTEGAYYPVTVLSDVQKGMPAYDEELFGPVAAVIRVKNEEEAIKTANDSQYGLGAAIFSRDVEKAEHIAAGQLQAGCCFVNDFVRSDPRLPFGGIKNSGYGRELSEFGIREFVNIKTVYLQ